MAQKVLTGMANFNKFFSGGNNVSKNNNKKKSKGKIMYSSPIGPMPQAQPEYASISDVLKSSGGSGRSGGGGYGASVSRAGTPVDLSAAMAAYDQLDAAYRQSAESSKQAAKNSYDNTMNTLLTSLKRYQEQHAKSVDAQKQSYLTGQSALENARSEADRQSRISASSRGLSGSGLQQLSQLQNLLNQSQEVSDLVTQNQSVMDNLRTALAQHEEDYKTNAEKAQNTYNEMLADIESKLAGNLANTASQRANLQYEANEAAASRALSAALSGGGGGGYGGGRSSSNDARNISDYLSQVSGTAANNADAYARSQAKKGTKDYKKAYNAYISDTLSTVDSYIAGLGIYNTKEVQNTYRTLNGLLKN